MSNSIQKIAYKRVSTAMQSTKRQLIDMEFDKVFEDVLSGKDRERPQLLACLDYIREGDHLYIHSIDRLARSFKDLLSLVDTIVKKKNVDLHFHSENITFSHDKSNPTNEFLFHIMGAVAQFERQLLLERQFEGIAVAKAAGKYKGRKRAFSLNVAREIKTRLKDKDVNVSAVAREFNVCREVIYKIKKAQHPYKALAD